MPPSISKGKGNDGGNDGGNGKSIPAVAVAVTTIGETNATGQAPPRTSQDAKLNANASATEENDDDDEVDVLHIPANTGLISNRRKSIRDRVNADDSREWQRPYWLGGVLFLILFAFWLLDSLKDPIFAKLVDGNLDSHQPPAKIVSVVTTLILVCVIEVVSNQRQKERQQNAVQQIRSAKDVMSSGGTWSTMALSSEGADPHEHQAPDDTVSISIFYFIGIPYIAVFGVYANILSHYDVPEGETRGNGFDGWYVLGYILYACIESFGSLAVASFWSYTNSTLSLADAERYYGPIIALAQLGAIGGATTVASNQWLPMQLLVLACLMIVLLLVAMHTYHQRFPPTSFLAAGENSYRNRDRIMTWQDDDVTLTQPFWSGILLILRHNYVLLILGVSCLYEVSLTCLDYQMKLLGWNRFEHIAAPIDSGMSFSQFMGHYGQVVNGTSLIVSSLIFPWLLKRVGLRITLRLFPTLLVVATVVAYVAFPGNLAVLFVSLSLLKAMTYSLHDPAKEMLYLPTSNAIKFRSKFWIDVVGARVSKAFGSVLNTYAGSVDRSVRVGSLPSLLTAVALLWASYKIGIEFDGLLQRGDIVGLDANLDDERDTYLGVAGRDEAEWSRPDAPSQPEQSLFASQPSSSNNVDEQRSDSSASVGMKSVELTGV